MAIDEKVLESKIQNKEALSKEETDYVMKSVDGESSGKTSDGEGVDFSDAEDIDKKDDAKPASDKKEAGDAKADEAKIKADTEAKAKAAEADVAGKKGKEAEEGIFQKVEKELAKPEGEEDLAGLSEREKGLYYALKGERKKRQKAEEDRDEVLFRDVKARKVAEAKEAAEKAKPEPEVDIELDGEDEDFITVKDAKKIVDALKKKGKPADDGEADEVTARNRNHTIFIAEMSARDVVEARTAGGQKDLPDFDTTMKIGELIVEANPEYQKEIYKAYKTGRNPALVTYDLVRKDPKFAALHGKTEVKTDDKAKEGKENLKKLEENEKKPKTSGAQGGGSAEDLEGYTAQALINMSPREFRKVPKHIREKFLYNT